ncbi:TAUTOMERASE/MIF SUPERFAMILY PROTEIN [Salix koriyanagi]|uniref:L-dopachrome isomerase n=1 Tax=Salix koriyanagi TaxID=2511006 RepID=A0A9Q0ZUP5_9ROSI|nr:TAUTOMERASE/MIF SUPERFAMILY PROTEIN [Salix koriyanagi]
MPTLNLHTNIPVDAVTTSDILKDATKALSKIIGKPESVKYPVQQLSYYKTIADILQTKLSIDSSRFYIKFFDSPRSFFGFNGTTF